MNNYLVCGASSGIGLALVSKICQFSTSGKVLATHRPTSTLTPLKTLKNQYPEKLELISLQATEPADYVRLQERIQQWQQPLDYCINAIGLLHDKDLEIFPERKLDEFQAEAFQRVIATNVTPTVLLAKHLIESLRASEAPTLVAVSAKVGSIADNRMGGWYSYRISKTALNMAIKNIAIELGRYNSKACVLALHPGTTDTKLSEPFMESAKKKYKIHSPEDTADNLLTVIETARQKKDSGAFYSWDGTQLPW